MILEFDQEKHEYRHGGESVPGVTTILGPLKDFSMVSPEIMAAASAFGTAVHKMAELYLANSLDYASLDENLYGPLEALECWLGEVKPFDGPPARIDIKSRPFDRVADPVQLAAYDQLAKENGLDVVTIERPLASSRYRYAGTPDIIIPGDGPPNWRVLHLRRDGKYRYTACYDPNAWPIFGRLLSDYHRQRETEQLIHSWRNRI